jgi:hypothetical protein
MRRVEVVDGLLVGFPGRSTEFTEGVEIGLVAAALATGWASIEMKVGAAALEQARDLASALGYRVVGLKAQGEDQLVTFANGTAKARLQLVR